MKHVVALSGGKDSTAMALRLAEVEPRDYTYICTPTGDENAETFAHWRHLADMLGKPLIPVTAHTTLDGLIRKQKMIPNHRARWCTRMLKIEPAARWLALNTPCVYYVGPRASTFGVYLADLSKRGLVESTTGMVKLTPAGLRLADVPNVNDRQGLHDAARSLLGPQEARVFDVIYAAWPKEIRRDDVARKVGLSPGASTAGVYISGVAAYGIIEPSSRGCVRAAEWLFPEKA